MRPLPLAAGLLVATARATPGLAAVDFGIEVKRRSVEVAAERMAGAAVVGFSLYTWNQRYSLAVAAALRARSPSTLVVVGGPSVPRREPELEAFLVANPAVGLAVLGEGELAFREICERVLAGASARGVAGAAWLEAGRAVRAATRDRLKFEGFSATASPYLDGTFDELVESGEVEVPVVSAVFETNRGCPFSCSFCDWGQATESRVNELPLERVLGELAWAARARVPYVYLVDANFGIRKRDPGIIAHIAELKAQTGAPRFVYFHLTKNANARNLRTVELLQEAGIESQVSLSMQDFDRRVLRAIRRDNIDPADALTLRERCHERGLPTSNELLLGLPEQTRGSVVSTVVSALTPFPGDSFFLYPVRLLPNAPLAHEADGLGLITRSVPLWPRDPSKPHPVPEVETLVVGSPTLPIPDWREAFVFGHALAALHDQSLLPASLPYAVWRAGMGVAAFVERLLEAFPAMREALERFADAILSEEASTLPIRGHGELRWEPIDAAVAAVLDAPEAFFGAVTATFGALAPPAEAETLMDALAFDAAVLATRAAPEARLRLSHDWVSARDARVAPTRGAFEVRVEATSPMGPMGSAAAASEHLAWFLAQGWARSPRRRVIATRCSGATPAAPAEGEGAREVVFDKPHGAA